MGDYQPLRSDDAHPNNHAPVHNKPTVYYSKPMSPLRKLAFGCSILLCFITIVVFLWVVPCDWSKCPAKTQRQPIMSWDRSVEGMEIMGPLKVVRGLQGLNIVAMYRGPMLAYDGARDQFLPKTGGLISFIGTSGLIAWFRKLPLLTHLDCFMLHIGDDSMQDCLVRGDNGYLALIDSLSGIAKWRAQKNIGDQLLVDVSFPVVTPDVDGDWYHDLAVTGRLENRNHRIIAIISGQTGYVMGKPMEVEGCTDINNLTLDRDYTLYYTCKNSTSKLFSERQVALVNAVQMMTNRSVVPHGTVPMTTRHLGNEWSVNGYRLNLVNSGHSPSDYQVSVTVTDHNNQSVWSPTMQQTYAMTPVVLHFQHAISGFLLKFWYWHSPHDQKKDKEGNIMNSLSERVVLVTFNATGSTHIVNASQTEIVQLCFNRTCQPELSSQTESLLIVDLDEDGSQELISYMVTFQPRDKTAPALPLWKLQSKLRLIRLESELPKLYEAIQRH
uniref:FAM234A/B beta-propeller domain-containing protein n=1 Tax=Cuerna arida TaxID=1464854 RepID=A0A1B6FAQ1_9HEMI